MKFSHKFVNSIEQIGEEIWQEFALQLSPFCQYSFLYALEKSGSVGVNTGWSPQHLILYKNKQPVAVMPLYKKTHSYGEYVFDFAWANTYQQYGLHYYPKLVCAIPFTPVTGPRLLLKSTAEQAEISKVVCQLLADKLQRDGLSSMHWLFVEPAFSETLTKQQQLQRRSVQFQWFNRQYHDFTDFLQTLNSRKRKSIRTERNKVAKAGITIERIHGFLLQQSHMDFFYRCYQQTYLKRSGHGGYLSESFFKQILDTMGDNLMLVIASRDNQPIASALFLFDNKQLNGRYWGAIEEADQLHFECCYYQGIEFCIEQGIDQFNPGTQGEHKILRGFEPIYCYSNHKLKELAFHEAVGRFIVTEDLTIEQYKLDAEQLLPFRKADK
ncbi:GNAT family N-acetyltransferase [Paraglaciecola sp.]|uniref:GNAT family N-acetyltransferase n=1 Tax=Paraglaciecola sp. TaxID=1920173 RepID=UPI0030F3B2BA